MPEYEFNVHFHALSWLECLDNFGFPAIFYYIFITIVCLLILFVIFLSWLIYYKLSKVIPRPPLQIMVYLRYSLKSF